jgi:hypothetical protein
LHRQRRKVLFYARKPTRGATPLSKYSKIPGVSTQFDDDVYPTSPYNMAGTPRGAENTWRFVLCGNGISIELHCRHGKGVPSMRSMYNGPGIYLIRVAGRLDAEWSDRLGGLTIVEPETTGDGAVPIVELTGWLADQAALFGVLNTLYDNRYPLLSVQYSGPSQERATR